MNISEAGPLDPPAARAWLDRPVLISNLVSGAFWLGIPALSGGWALSLVGAVYVVVASLFLAAVYARDVLTMGQEALAWATPWLAAVALWAALIGFIEMESAASGYLSALYVGLVLGTPCYFGWQMLALAIRQLLAWRSKASSART